MPNTHTLSSPSSLMVDLVGSSVPILYQNLACPPRYPLRKGKCCRCRVEPGILPTFGVVKKLGFGIRCAVHTGQLAVKGRYCRESIFWFSFSWKKTRKTGKTGSCKILFPNYSKKKPDEDTPVPPRWGKRETMFV